MSKAPFIKIVVWATAVWPLFLAAGESSTPTFQYVIRGFEQTNTDLRKGAVEIVGQQHIETSGGAIVESPILIFTAFDDAGNLFRFDRTETKQMQPTGTPKKVDVASRSAYCRLSDRALQLRGFPTHTLEILPLGTPAFDGFNSFDVRMIGLMLISDLQRPTGRELLKMLLDGPVDGSEVSMEVSADKDGIYSVVWTYPHKLRRTLQFDSVHGFTPIRSEMVHINDDGTSRLILLSTASWELRNDAWVPVRAQLESDTRLLNDRKVIVGKLDRYQFQFNWTSVNTNIPATIFSVEGLSPPRGTTIVDKRRDIPLKIDQSQ